MLQKNKVLRQPLIDQKYVDDEIRSPSVSGEDMSFTWDLCLVCKIGDEDKNIRVKPEKRPGYPSEDEDAGEVIEETRYFLRETARIVERCQNAGFKTLLYYSIQNDEIYCLLAATEERLKAEADRIQYELQLDAEQCISQGRKLGITLAKITDFAAAAGSVHDAPLLTREDWCNIYGRFESSQRVTGGIKKDNLYRHYDSEGPYHPNTLFRSIDRIKLTLSIIEADCEQVGVNGAGLKLNKFLAKDTHPLKAYYPLHQYIELDNLKRDWTGCRMVWTQPLDQIRNYFGEQIGLYFAFLQFYSKWLIPMAALGVVMFVWQMDQMKVAVSGISAFGVVVLLWSCFFLEFWKRREGALAAHWGMTGFKQKEQPRPEFEGAWEISPIDGRWEETFPFLEKVKRMMFSQAIIWSLILTVIACVVGIFVFRGILENSIDKTYAGYIAGIVNAIQIQVLNYGYSWVADKLNHYENHRTQTEYENALISKSFLFKFVNSYNSLFYIAFIKRYDDVVGGCPDDNCLSDLQKQLATIFVTDLLVNNLIELFKPIIQRARMRREESSQRNLSFKQLLETDSSSEVGMSAPEKEYLRVPYPGTFSDFDEIVIQYGYLSLFVIAFPLAPLLAMINNWFEVKFDSKRLCDYSRRPVARGAQDVGMWGSIFNILSVIAIMTNLAVVVFETDTFDKYSLTTKFLIFVVTEHVLLLIKFLVYTYMPMDQRAVDHVARQNYIVDSLIGGWSRATKSLEADLVLEQELEIRRRNAANNLEEQYLEEPFGSADASLKINLDFEEKASERST